MKQLVIEIGASPGPDFPVRLYDLDTGTEAAKGTFTATAPAINALQPILTKSPNEIEAAGILLSSWLFTALGNTLQAEWEAAEQRRIFLDIRPSALYALPWEILAWNRASPFGVVPTYVRDAHLLSRIVAPLAASQPPPSGPIRVLVLIGCDDDDPDALSAEELAGIHYGLHDTHGAVDIRVVRRPADLNALYEGIKPYRPHVLHFIGHGNANPPNLIVGNWPWTIGTLTDFGQEILKGWRPRLAFLNACRTAQSDSSLAPVAGAFLLNRTDAVIAMQGNIKGAAAGQLAATFYAALAGGAPVDAALTIARTVVARSKEPRESFYPALTLSAHPGTVLPRLLPPAELGPYLQNLKYCPLLPKLRAFVNQSESRGKLHSSLWPFRESDPASPFLFLRGNSGYGKTLLSAWLLHLAVRVGHQVRYVMLQPGGLKSLDSISILRRIWGVDVTPPDKSPLMQPLPLDPTGALKLDAALQSGKDTNTAYEKFRLALASVAASRPLTLVLDEFSRCMDEGSFTEFWNKFIAYLGTPELPNVSVLFSLTREEYKDYVEALGLSVPLMNAIDLQPLSTEDFVAAFRDYLRYSDPENPNSQAFMSIVENSSDRWAPLYIGLIEKRLERLKYSVE